MPSIVDRLGHRIFEAHAVALRARGNDQRVRVERGVSDGLLQQSGRALDQLRTQNMSKIASIRRIKVKKVSLKIYCQSYISQQNA